MCGEIIMDKTTNTQIADVLDRIAELLESQNDNPFRVRAYREGAQTIRNLETPVAEFARKEQTDKLTAIPNIGEGIASVIEDYVASGKSSLLDELESKASPEAAFGKVPGIGPELAERIVEHLHIETLPELEKAAHDGRLAEVEGFGSKRVEGVRTALAGMLSRSARTQQRTRTADGNEQKSGDRPSVELLLEIDADYRKKSEAGELQKIAPRRFNPKNEAWLPVLRIKRKGWDFTALYSNTAQAHKLEKTNDWVVIYYEQSGKEHQNTVVTETKGALKGKRVVRGREAENQRYYQAQTKRR
jgi:DNA polymerase (family X)